MTGKGCLRAGCFGCLGILGILVLIAGVLLAASLIGGSPERRIERIERTSDLPVRPEAVEAIDVAEPGRVILDVSMANFELVPGPAGQPIRLEGRYDAGSFELEESYEPYGELGWTYRLAFSKRGLWLKPFLEDGPSDNDLRLIVPRDAPIRLEGAIGVAESRLNLGGLWLLSADLDFGVGDHEIGFPEALPFPMERLTVSGSIGELRLEKIGNASPARVEVRHSMGEVTVDLRGAWTRDAEVDVLCGVGQCTVRAPKDTRLELDGPHVMIGETGASSGVRDAGQLPGPTVRLSVSGKVGEVRVD